MILGPMIISWSKASEGTLFNTCRVSVGKMRTKSRYSDTRENIYTVSNILTIVLRHVRA